MTINLIEILYPRRCPICNSIVKKRLICKECLDSLDIIKPPVCIKCGKKLDSERDYYCSDCRSFEKAFVENRAVFAYKGEIRNAMYDLKYANRRENAEFFGEAIVQKYGRYIKGLGIDVIVPIPLHKKRLRKRGYNQTALVAKYVGTGLDIPVNTELLAREQSTRAQKYLNNRERKNNVKSAFKVYENDVKYDRILLIDDIYTTGATLHYATKELMNEGVGAVYTITVCIGRGY